MSRDTEEKGSGAGSRFGSAVNMVLLVVTIISTTVAVYGQVALGKQSKIEEQQYEQAIAITELKICAAKQTVVLESLNNTLNKLEIELREQRQLRNK